MAGLTMASAAFVACTDYTYMDENTMLQGLAEEAYDQAFIETYGKPSWNQTWDLTPYTQLVWGRAIGKYGDGATSRAKAGNCPYGYDLDSNDWAKYSARINQFEEEGYFDPSNNNGGNKYYSLGTDVQNPTGLLTKYTSETNPSWIPGDGSTYDYDSNHWYKIETTTLNWLNDKLQERYNNRHLGTPFELRMAGTGADYDFDIIPIYQGETTMNWALHLVKVAADGSMTDYTLWKRSEGLKYYEYNGAGGGEWKALDYSLNGGHVMNQNNVAGRKMKVNSATIGKDTDFFLYLDIAKGNVYRDKLDGSPTGYWHLAETGYKQRSDEGMMVALATNAPTNLGSGKHAMIIGCEDASMTSTDVDLNDVVFLLVGKNLPKVKQVVKKRYMIEDLGEYYNSANTSYETLLDEGRDFDFNDIVVDLTEETIDETTIQKAQFKSFCGTLPVKVKIGDQYILGDENTWYDPQKEGVTPDKLKGEWNHGYLPDRLKNPIIITDNKWNSDPTDLTNGNNITVLVQHGSTTTNNKVSETTFPHMGDIPKILAVSQTCDWNNENVTVLKELWDKWKEIKVTNQNQGPQGGDGELGYDPNNLGTKLVCTSTNLTVNREKEDDGQYIQHLDLGDVFRNCTGKKGIICIEVPAHTSFYGVIQSMKGSWPGWTTQITNDTNTKRAYTRILDGEYWEAAKEGKLRFDLWGNQNIVDRNCYFATDEQVTSGYLQEEKRLQLYYKHECNDAHLSPSFTEGLETVGNYQIVDNGGATSVDLNDLLKGCSKTQETFMFKDVPAGASFTGKFVGELNGADVSSEYIVINNGSSIANSYSYILKGDILTSAEFGNLKFEYSHVSGCSFVSGETNRIEIWHTPCTDIHYIGSKPTDAKQIDYSLVQDGSAHQILFAGIFDNEVCNSDHVTITFELPAGTKFDGRFQGNSSVYFEFPESNISFKNPTNVPVFYNVALNDKAIAAAKNGTLKFFTYSPVSTGQGNLVWNADATKRVKVYYSCGHDNHSMVISPSIYDSSKLREIPYSAHLVKYSKNADGIVTALEFPALTESGNNFGVVFQIPAGMHFNGKYSGDNYRQYPGSTGYPTITFNNNTSETKFYEYGLPSNGIADAKNGKLKFTVYWSNSKNKFLPEDESDQNYIKIYVVDKN
ncbi:MAG: hypothetical protein MJZ69_02485 [Bacteroidaceae bacterium]|nr:hypothetical protein [Bacteroidaceae bacterium]